jgi:2-iminobutanoate/2-iminopropanoate deaminase
MSERELIVVPGVGNPQWYSGAARYGELVWTAGQVPVAQDGSLPEDFGEQVELVLDNLETTLEETGANLGTLLKVNAYLVSLDDFEVYNDRYTARLGPLGLPPRTTVEIVRLPPPMMIELEAVAHIAADAG